MPAWVGISRFPAADAAAGLSRIVARGVEVMLVFSEGDPGLDFVQRRHSRELRSLARNRANLRNGAVCRLGRKHSIPTPVSDTVTALLAAIDEHAAG